MSENRTSQAVNQVLDLIARDVKWTSRIATRPIEAICERSRRMEEAFDDILREAAHGDDMEVSLNRIERLAQEALAFDPLTP